MGRSASKRGLNPWTTLFYTFGFAPILLLLVDLLLGGLLPGTATCPADLLWLGNTMDGWCILFMLAAGSTVTGFGLYNVSLGYFPSSVANLIVPLKPVITSVIDYFMLSERLNRVQLSGSLIIVIGIVFMRIYEGWQARKRVKVLERYKLVNKKSTGDEQFSCLYFGAGATGFEPAISALTGPHVNHYTTPPNEV